MNQINLTPRQAFTLAQNGVFVSNGGYTWRNHNQGGQYLSQGTYPGNIRYATTFEFFRFEFKATKRLWRIYQPVKG